MPFESNLACNTNGAHMIVVSFAYERKKSDEKACIMVELGSQDL